MSTTQCSEVYTLGGEDRPQYDYDFDITPDGFGNSNITVPEAVPGLEERREDNKNDEGKGGFVLGRDGNVGEMDPSVTYMPGRSPFKAPVGYASGKRTEIRELLN